MYKTLEKKGKYVLTIVSVTTQGIIVRELKNVLNIRIVNVKNDGQPMVYGIIVHEEKEKWDILDPKSLKSIVLPDDEICIDVSHDYYDDVNRCVVIATRKKLYIWDMKKQEIVYEQDKLREDIAFIQKCHISTIMPSCSKKRRILDVCWNGKSRFFDTSKACFLNIPEVDEYSDGTYTKSYGYVFPVRKDEQWALASEMQGMLTDFEYDNIQCIRAKKPDFYQEQKEKAKFVFFIGEELFESLID